MEVKGLRPRGWGEGGYGEGGFGGEPSGGEGRREGTSLKPTTGQYVVGTSITALCACVCVRVYTLWLFRERRNECAQCVRACVYIVVAPKTRFEQCYTVCVYSVLVTLENSVLKIQKKNFKRFKILKKN